MTFKEKLQAFYQRIEPNLPSKHFMKQLGVLAGVALVVGIIMLKPWKMIRIGKGLFMSKKQGELLIVQDIALKDTDGDGVVDWEERLWGTDPTKADTNGDGTPDGVAIEALRTPNTTGAGTTAQTAGEINQTEQFARESISTIMALNDAGALDSKTSTEISNKMYEYINGLHEAPQITRNDIKISSDKRNDIGGYVGALATILNKSMPKNDTAIYIVGKAIQNNDFRDIKKIQPIQIGYKAVSDKLKATPVPPQFMQAHIDLINATASVSSGIAALEKVENDPVVALSAILKLDKAYDAMNRSLISLQNSIATLK